MRILSADEAQATILRRQAWDEVEAPETLLASIETIFGERLAPDEAVRRILRDVRARGDQSLIEWSRRLDGREPAALRVTDAHFEEARAALPVETIDALKFAASRIDDFHRRQPAPSWMHNNHEGTLGQIVRPIASVGIYAPGGSAPLPSSVLMTAVPARVAGVEQLVVISPPQRGTGLPHPSVLVAAEIAGVGAVYVAGGAQAIGALAFGTETVPRVDKICGPGSLFTTLAKRQVYGLVGIDGLPGPTETLVIADEHADAEWAAADLLAQAEHDQMASAILVTPSRALAERVQAAILQQVETLERSEIIEGSLSRGSGIVLVADLHEAFQLANAYAPEHLCLLVREPWSWLGHVRHAGGVFLGEHSFEVLGDYVAGPSHVMPTGATARFASPVNVLDFVKIVSVIGLNESAMRAVGPAAETLARAEGLTAHAAAVQRRLAT